MSAGPEIIKGVLASSIKQESISKNDVSDNNTIAGLSKPAFYGIIGGITGLLLLIIVVIIIPAGKILNSGIASGIYFIPT